MINVDNPEVCHLVLVSDRALLSNSTESIPSAQVGDAFRYYFHQTFYILKLV